MEGPSSVESQISRLPRENGWLSSDDVCFHHYQGFWYYPSMLKIILDPEESYRWTLSPSDILLCCNPKSGTTWLKALAFAIVTRNRYRTIEDSPLLSSTPHKLVPFMEFPYHARDPEIPLISTHIPYTSLPDSVFDCNRKMIYICRDPKDAFVSLWHFSPELRPNKNSTEPISLDQAFELFCRGVSFYGPYWDHVLGYWKASQERPNNVLFLKYEDMMEDPYSYVVSIARFMGYAFSNEEEIEGVHTRIVKMCSFESLRNLEVNKKLSTSPLGFDETFANESLYRKGKVGDWRNYLTQEMADRIDQITRDKLKPFGLEL